MNIELAYSVGRLTSQVTGVESDKWIVGQYIAPVRRILLVDIIIADNSEHTSCK